MRTENKILFAFILALGVVLLLGGLAFETSRGLLRQNRRVVHTYEVLGQLDGLFDVAQDAEAGMRGFLLNPREELLESYYLAQGGFRQKVAALRDRVSDNPSQVEETDRLAGLVQRRLDNARERVEARRAGSLESVLPLILTGSGQQAMAEVRAQIAKMKGVENALLKQRTDEFTVRGRKLQSTFILLMAVDGLLLTVFFALLRGDFSERRRFAARLELNERRFRTLLESAPDALILSEVGGEIVFVNAAFERNFGCQRENAVGRPLHEFLVARSPIPARAEDDGFANANVNADAAPSGRPAAQTPGNGAGRPHAGPAAATGPLEQIERALPRARFEGVRPDGSRFPAEVTFSSLVIPAGAGSGQEDATQTLAGIRDRTERDHAEDEIRRISEDLAHSNAELERFAYVASHDLQEPLRMVSSYTQLLGRRYRGKLDASADEFINYAVDGATRMQTLINDLLAFSRVGSKPKEFRPVDCGALLERVLHDLQATLEPRGATVLHDDPLPTVRGDAVQLGQLFQNLIGNATKFARPDTPPRVRITVQRRSRGWHRFNVTDNGIGIEPRYFERIFLVFQRLHTKQDYPGTGIGLAICKRIVERHGGQLWVESKPGQGASFLFTLPAQED